MSLTTPPQVKQYRLGVIAAKTLDDPGYLDELLGDKTETISHLYSNGANPFVAQFAADHGLPLTTFPLTGGRSLPWAISRIIENSDFVYIIGTPQSKSAGQAATECELRKVKHRLIQFEPCQYWKDKAMDVAEFITAMTAEDVERAGPWLTAVKELI